MLLHMDVSGKNDRIRAGIRRGEIAQLQVQVTENVQPHALSRIVLLPS
jgi:hypothetical protein